MNAELTPKETEIFRHKFMNPGKADKQIAHDLKMSINTLSTHKKNMFVKLNIHSNCELIALGAKIIK